MVLGQSGDELVNRLSNKIYEACRLKSIQLPNFPDFGPTIAALREGSMAPTNSDGFKVCIQQHDKLKILESMASKWLATESLKDKALEMIEHHNSIYNIGGEMLLEDRSAKLLDSSHCI